MERPLTTDEAVAFRPATEADYARLERLVRDWWGEWPPRFERLWLRHFGPTTLVGESMDGRVIALAVAFRAGSGSRGAIRVVAVAPGRRRRGIGAAMVAALESRLAVDGVLEVEAEIWPGNRAGVRFFEALGYAPIPESLATPLYGIPAIVDYDGPGEDRSVFVHELGEPPG